MHRDIMNALPDEWVYHINKNSLDNRRQNLKKKTVKRKAST